MIAAFANAFDFINNLKAASRAMCPDPVRAGLHCVRIEIGNGLARFVATNGHWLWVNEVACREVEGVDEKGLELLRLGDRMTRAVLHIVPSDVKDLLRKIDKSKRVGSMPLTLDTEARQVVQLGTTISFAAEPSITFPPYEQIIPGAIVAKGPAVSADFLYIGQIVEAFDDVVEPEKAGAGIVIENGGSHDRDPLIVTSKRSSALAILMPRIDEHSGANVLARYKTRLATAA